VELGSAGFHRLATVATLYLLAFTSVVKRLSKAVASAPREQGPHF
jgi:hypothetical protein